MPLIEFHAEPELLGKIPEPFPASRAVPDWLKQLPVDFQGGPTIKRCAPFLGRKRGQAWFPRPGIG